jgi:hypothetical protein
MRYPNWPQLQEALADVPRGEYLSAELLPVFNDWAARSGQEPITAKQLGEAIARELTLDSRRCHGNARRWHLTPEGLACRNWFVEPSKP